MNAANAHKANGKTKKASANTNVSIPANNSVHAAAGSYVGSSSERNQSLPLSVMMMMPNNANVGTPVPEHTALCEQRT